MSAQPSGHPPRRALVTTHYWHPHIGGIETVAAQQSTRLVARGWTVDAFTSRLGDASHERREGVDVHRFACINWQERALHVPVPLVAPTMLGSLLRQGRRADVIIAHGHAYISSIYAAMAARQLGLPFVLIQHNPFVEYPALIEAVERGVDATAGRRLLTQAAVVICVSRFTQDYVRSIAPRARTEVVYSGVDTSRFAPSSMLIHPEFSTSPGPLDRSRPVVATLRRLVPRNGVDVLIKAWRINGLGAHGQLMIGGDGAERPALERLAAGDASIHFLGRVPDRELPNFYRSASIFVLPSVSGEGFGLVAAEALASGIPVVTTDAGATGELVRHGIDGLVVSQRDPAALADAIRHLLDDPNQRRAMANAATRRHDQLGWDNSLDRLERCVSDVIGA